MNDYGAKIYLKYQQFKHGMSGEAAHIFFKILYSTANHILTFIPKHLLGWSVGELGSKYIVLLRDIFVYSCLHIVILWTTEYSSWYTTFLNVQDTNVTSIFGVVIVLCNYCW